MVDKIICWDDDYGPEELEPDMLALYDAVIVAVESEKQAGYLYELLACIIGDDEGKLINTRYFKSAIRLL